MQQETINPVLKYAIGYYGKESQVIKAIEEMSELTKELAKNLANEKNIDAICEEIADVEIMIEQLREIYDVFGAVEKQRQRKIRRLALRMDYAETTI